MKSTIVLSILTLLYSFSTKIEPCKGLNIGIKSEKILTYIVVDHDTLLKYTTELRYNPLGFTEKAVSFSNDAPDTSVTEMEYKGHQIIGWKEYKIGESDTVAFVAVDWHQNGRGSKFVEQGKTGSYSTFTYENCLIICKKTYEQNELIYKIDYEWEGTRLKQTTSWFYDNLKETIGKSKVISSYNLENFDSKRNWTARSFTKDDEKFFELRFLTYY